MLLVNPSIYGFELYNEKLKIVGMLKKSVKISYSV